MSSRCYGRKKIHWIQGDFWRSKVGWISQIRLITLRWSEFQDDLRLRRISLFVEYFEEFLVFEELAYGKSSHMHNMQESSCSQKNSRISASTLWKLCCWYTFLYNYYLNLILSHNRIYRYSHLYVWYIYLKKTISSMFRGFSLFV